MCGGKGGACVEECMWREDEESGARGERIERQMEAEDGNIPKQLH